MYVSCISTPAMFWVQNVGPNSIDPDKLTQEMTSYYSKLEYQVATIVGQFCNTFTVKPV